MNQLWSFLRGKVYVCVNGEGKEAFISACARENLAVWSVKRGENGGLYMYVKKRTFLRLCTLADENRCEVMVCEEKGFPLFIWSIRKRKALFFGLAILILAFSLSTRFILVIDVVGNETLTKHEITSKLQQHGVGIGTYVGSLDTRELSNEILLSMEELSFISINIHGMKAEVIVKERAVKPDILDEAEILNVVSTAQGTILHMEVLKGQAKVQKGDAVNVGDLLISGIHTPEEDLSMESKVQHQPVRAEGRVYAQIRHEDRAVIPSEMQIKRQTGEKITRYAFHMFGKRINFYRNAGISFEKYDKINEVNLIELPFGVVLPVHFEKEVFYEYETEPVTMQEEVCVEMLKESLFKYVEQLVGDEGDILLTQYVVHQKDGVVEVAQMADCFQQIGKMVPVEQNSNQLERNDALEIN